MSVREAMASGESLEVRPIEDAALRGNAGARECNVEPDIWEGVAENCPEKLIGGLDLN